MMGINLAIILLAYIRPPYFERSPYGMGIWIVWGIGGLVGEKKPIICKVLIFNPL
jgi:hypothetical protein